MVMMGVSVMVVVLVVMVMLVLVCVVGMMCGYFDEFSVGLVLVYVFSMLWSEGLVVDVMWVRGVGDYKKVKKEVNVLVLVVSDGLGVLYVYMSVFEMLSGEVGGVWEVFFYD